MAVLGHQSDLRQPIDTARQFQQNAEADADADGNGYPGEDRKRGGHTHEQ